MSGGSGDDTINGDEGNDWLFGGSGDDTINGGSGNDRIYGGSGDDTISGGEGNDVLIGGWGDDDIDGGSGNDIIIGDGCWWETGNDTLTGGAGNDYIFAGRGTDEAIYQVAINQGNRDYYDGGWGNDTLTLKLTTGEWQRADIRADVDAYLAFLDSQTGSGSHQAGLARFEFKAFDLNVKRFEELKVVVDGVEVDPTNSAPVAVNDAFTVTEGDTENGGGALTASVLANDTDLDGDTLVVSSFEGANAGTFVSITSQSGNAVIDARINGTGDMIILPISGINELAIGQSETFQIEYTVSDGNGGEDTASATVTITGTNDAPTVAAAITASADEDAAGFSVDLLQGASDVDNGDTLNVANVAGLVAGVTLNGNSLDVDPSDASFQSLAAGDTQDIVVTYDIEDGNGWFCRTNSNSNDYWHERCANRSCSDHRQC